MAARIWVDGLFLHEHFMGSGINRYLSSLLREIEVATRGCAEFRTSVLVHPAMAPSACALALRPGFDLRPFSFMRFRRAWRLGAFVPVIGKLVAPTLFLPSPVPIHLKPDRLAVTVHDVIPFLFPSHQPFPYGPFLRHAYSSCLLKADLIFTDSEHSKADIVSRFEISPDKIVVTYLGYDSDLFSPFPVDAFDRRETLERHGITEPYILHVGTTDPRKNLIRLTKAYRLLCDRRNDFSAQLVLCGRIAPGSEDLRRTIRESGAGGRVIMLDRIPDRDLEVLYKAAAGCAMPSVYEGFGLPILEAMASGVPVMSSNRSSLPEVGGNAVLYFDPESVEDMSFAMERLLGDSELRKKLVERGLQRAKQFSWEACARTTLDALRSL